MKHGRVNWVAKVRRVPLEAFVWLTVLAAPAFLSQDRHYPNFCAFKWLGWEAGCPGCGLGRALIQLYHGHLGASLESHWAAIPAVGVIAARVVGLCRAAFRGGAEETGNSGPVRLADERSRIDERG